ncbi:hypothetical protein GOARA_061_00300 [Gordonia araii NBRC 100433]|uniref:Sulfotransferase family protein n=1 Tax=Gordonia araii NBRC 100433 TaxID=1073574 RepID=G7H416_9ACTN|nr:hypothetical protein [Gordonia araii]NNG96344.1 sulfotransferase family protein [Gordonia araii NBRC 100433]GAB10591.1 hypothetical protein GOARA_061_00300 [Gordonia araii NBRC 100433]
MPIVYLHIGLPKTGTTHLQERLWANRRPAQDRAGLLFPGSSTADHFHAAAHLQPERFPAWASPESAGAWPAMLGQMRAWHGDSVVSHELFATMGPEQIASLLGDLDFADEVRVILTVRDLARQIPSVWQETLQNRQTTTFDDFFASVANHAPGGPRSPEIPEVSFWELQDYAAIAQRWAEALGAGQVHIVTVPAAGAVGGDALWDRFLAVLGVDPALLPELDHRANNSIGAAQNEFLRRLNVRLGPDVAEWWRYELLVKRQFGGDALRQTSSGRSGGLSGAHRRWAAGQADAMIAAVADRGYALTGSLDDLRVSPHDDGGAPAVPPAEDVLEAGLDALAYWIQKMPLPEQNPKPPSLARRAAGRAKREARRLGRLR